MRTTDPTAWVFARTGIGLEEIELGELAIACIKKAARRGVDTFRSGWSPGGATNGEGMG
jgi:hypothetical protein